MPAHHNRIIRTCMRLCRPACIHPYMHTPIHPSIHPSIHTCMHACTRPCIRASNARVYILHPALGSYLHRGDEDMQRNEDSQLRQHFAASSNDLRDNLADAAGPAGQLPRVPRVHCHVSSVSRTKSTKTGSVIDSSPKILAIIVRLT